MPVQCTCLTCGKTLTRRPSYVRERNYCDRICGAIGDRTRIRPGKSAGIEIVADGATARIPLRTKSGSVRAYATIDAIDAAWADQWRWCLSNGRAARFEGSAGRYQQVLLHRDLLGLPRISDGRDGDHIDRDPLNNRRCNLRILPKGGNSQNVPGRKGASSFRGVDWHKKAGKWRARVHANGEITDLGLFTDEHEAAEAARAARARLMPYATD